MVSLVFTAYGVSRTYKIRIEICTMSLEKHILNFFLTIFFNVREVQIDWCSFEMQFTVLVIIVVLK